jgi:protein dithiol:quinone oxidoreductase
MRSIWMNISNRWLYLAGALIVGGLLSFGFYLQYVKHQDPCPLCMVQRVIFVAILVLFATAALQAPRRIGKRVYAFFITLLSVAGVAVAGRHIWIQNLPKDQVPACGPGLEYMLDTFPMAEVFKELLHGSGECAEKGWSFLSLGIPEWSLLCYIALGTWSILIMLRKAD